MAQLFDINLMHRLLSVLSTILLTGCSTLIIRNDDNVAVVAGKVIARAVGCVPTLCMTEAAMSDLKREEAFDQWFGQLTPEQQVQYIRDTDGANSQS